MNMLTTIEKKVEPKLKNVATIGWFQQCVHRSRNEIFTELKVVTPQLAEVILTNNPDNRKTKAIKHAQLVSDMASGRWTMNGEPIIIAKTGELNDGQHRLMALVEAKASLPMLFVFGVERESRVTVDQGAARTSGDYLHMEGVLNANQLAAIARYVIAYEQGDKKTLGATNRVTPAEVIDRAVRDRTLATSAQYAQRHVLRMRRYATGTVIGFCHNILLSIDVNDGLAFMEQLCTGENLQRGDPAFTARERLLGMESRSSAVRIEIILRAWNAYRGRRQLRTIPVHGRLPELV